MPAPGTTQQRFKTEVEILAERRSIEFELLRLNKERLEVAEEYKGVEKTLLKNLDRQYEKLNRLGKQKLNVEKTLAKLVDQIDHATSRREKKRLEGLYEEQSKKLNALKSYESIAKDAANNVKSELTTAKRGLELEQRRFEKAQNFLSKLGNVFSLQKKYYDVLKESFKLEGTRLVLSASLLAITEATFAIFKTMDEALAKFRIEMGMLRTNAANVSVRIREVATQFTQVGVTVESTSDAVKSLANEFGGTVVVSQDLIESTALLKSQLGVAEDSSAGFLRNISALSKTTAQSQRNMSYIAQNLASAAGIPLNLVMQDVAKMSANALALMSRMPMQIVKAAVAARQMGTTINKMADSSAQLLNFTENVQAEMEASVLVGRSVNLQLARELAYRRDIVGSTKAILAEARRINFENLDYFQMQAFATATGRTSDELLKMLQAQRQLQAARGIDGLKDEVALLDKLNSMRDIELKDSALQTEFSVKQMANQARLVALQNQWNQLLMEMLRVLYPVFDLVLKIGIVAVKTYPAIFGGISLITGAFKTLEVLLTIVSKAFMSIKGGMSVFSGIAMSLGTWAARFGKIFTFFKSFMGLGVAFSKLSFLAPFAKAIPVIGWIISAIQFAYNLFNRFQNIGFVKGDWIGNIKKGLVAIGGALYDTLIQPFLDVYDWIMKWLGGHSPSQIGLSIVKGILGVQAMIFDALTSPFRRFLAWIAEKIPGMGKLAETIRGGMQGAIQKSVTVESKPATVIAETPVPIKTQTGVESTSQEKETKEQNSTLLAEILRSINLLNSNLSSGKIGLYVDGQLLSATLARQTAFRGGYATNQISLS